MPYDGLEPSRVYSPVEALDQFVAVFMGFWESDREVRGGLGVRLQQLARQVLT
jgi:hypothetical protein